MKKQIGSSQDMLQWQYKMLIAELQQLELHASGDCPCILNELNPPERCVGKHSLNVFSLSQETAKMDPSNKELLLAIADEADEKHSGFKDFICHTEDLPELAEWARLTRKKLEPIYYSCKVKAKLKEEETEKTLKFAVGDRVKWLDSKRWITGLVEQAYIHKKTPNSYWIRVGDRLFTRYEPQLYLVSSSPSKFQEAPTVSVSAKCGTTLKSCRFIIRKKGESRTEVKEVTTTPSTSCEADSVSGMVEGHKKPRLIIRKKKDAELEAVGKALEEAEEI